MHHCEQTEAISDINTVQQVFSKCGILKEDDDGKPRIKIYRDKATGMIKGDGLVTYLKEPSVGLICFSKKSQIGCIRFDTFLLLYYYYC